MIKRFIKIEDYLEFNKVFILYGPRRSGKTTLLNSFLSETKLKYKLVNGDNLETQNVLSSQQFLLLKEFISGYNLLAIDEAQQIPEIGRGLKILIDQVPDLKIIATGSSSFGLMQLTGEPLTGRKKTMTLYPFAQMELLSIKNAFELKEELSDYLIFGSYPEVITETNRNNKIEILRELVNSYLYKDILSFEKVRNSKLLQNLVKLIAFQIGNPVSYNELATQLGVNVRTISRYLDLLEKSFVIYSLGSYGFNLRNEIKSKNKYYFYDNGIRNAVISQFNEIELRNDIGQLWENFIMIERLKKREYHKIYCNPYYWKTYSRKEIDLIEERDGKLNGYECKWSNTKSKAQNEFISNYSNSEFNIINKNNYFDFIT
jgi:uncharacterized protein